MKFLREQLAAAAAYVAKAHEVSPGVPSSLRLQNSVVCVTVCVAVLVLVEAVALGLVKETATVVAFSGLLVGLPGAYLVGKVSQHKDE